MNSDILRTSPLSRRTLIRSAVGLGALGTVGAVNVRPAHAAPGGKTAIVIGTGFGGSVAALRLGQAGFTTTVFERGRRWPIRPDGDTFATFTQTDGRAAWFSDSVGINSTIGIPVDHYPGILDRIKGNGIDAVYGTGVGGGSLAFGAFTPVPRKKDFEHVFPGRAGYDELASTYYPRATKMLNASELPADIMAHPRYIGTRSWRETVRRYGKEPVSFNYAIDWDIVRAELDGRVKPSIITGELGYGVNSGAKNSTDRNYLPAAERTGNVTIKPMHEVFEIRPRVRRPGFVVKARVIDYEYRTVRVVTAEADHLFLGAGSFHTTRLLVEARAKGTLPKLSARIGDGFGANGDFLTARTALSDDYGDIQGGPGFGRLYEDDLPGGPASIVYHSTPLPSPLGKAATTNLIQVHSDERGTIDFDHASRTAEINYPFPEGSDLDRRGIAFAESFRQRAETRHGRPGGIPIYSRAAGFGSASTYHGLGGVVMGRAAEMDGAVRGYDNLYVVDGSFVPGAVGLVNPSLTITALAERTMDRFVASH
ncbi:GMC oxidoreductase [Gordonia sp. LSe1-13]|uniref:Cholesterol oxidase n=1 Tax=Gordonia sesuvii TaxID=3116777 RepID=A0ABU7MBA5_9ACTN|nr:GMC oxidoreductase [Gordonia sp. LSe1-13]MEE3850377.1 GMC oxidoreductase [Gordonia sp. LSe1-13]